MNQPELSGFVIPIILGYLSNTGNLTGSFYPLLGNPSHFATSGDFISQIDLDSAVTQALSYVASQYATENALLNTGDYLLGLINSSSAGVSSLNSLSGALSLTGKGNISVIQQGQGFAISGDTGIYSSFVTTGQTGSFGGSGSFYPLNSNPSGYVTTGQTGNFGIQTNTVFTTGNQDISGVKTFFNNSDFPNLKIQSGKAFDLANSESIDWNIRLLKSYDDTIEVDWNNGKLAYSGTDSFVDWKNSTLDCLGVTTLDWKNFLLWDSYGYSSLDWFDRYALDFAGNISLDWGARQLKDFSGNASLDWFLHQFSGIWSGQYLNCWSGLAVSGNPVVTGGPYYLMSNPSGYISSGQTGAFATTGNLNATGANLSGLITNNYLLSSAAVSTYATILNLNATGTGIANWTGLTTGLFYPRNTNPSGYITTGQTGVFVTTGQTGVFATQTQITTLNTWTGNSTGLFYPLATNPIGYISSGQTGIFATTGNLSSTGSALAAWTGSSVGLFYPLNTNPNRYLSSFYNGSVPFIANGSIVIMPGYDVLTDAAGNPILDAAGNYITQTTTGNLGVNQFNPQYTLDVGGSGNFSNGIYWSGNPVVTGGPYINNSTGIISVSGGFSMPLRMLSGNFSVFSGNSIILVDTTNTSSTGTFPNASGLIGVQFIIKDWKGNSSGKNITITGTNNQTFDGSLSKIISTSYGSYTIISDGANWSII